MLVLNVGIVDLMVSHRWPLFYDEIMLWPSHPITYLPGATRRLTWKSGAVRRGLVSRRGPTHESHQVDINHARSCD